MKKDMKRLSDLDAVIRDLFERGLTSETQVRDGIMHENRYDGEIEKLLKSLNRKGAVKDVHRAYYANWTEKWQLPTELINYAATLSADKSNPFAYMNAILLAWHDGGVTDIAAAKSAAPVTPQGGQNGQAAAPHGVVYERYTEEQLNSMFTVITEDND